jgi:hypothetical protein
MEQTVICGIHQKELKVETETLPDGRIHSFAKCTCDPTDSHWYGVVVYSSKSDPTGETVESVSVPEKPRSKFMKEISK